MLLKSWKEAAAIPGISVLELVNKIRRITGQKKHTCELCKTKMYINWDGKIYPCVQFQNRAEFQCGDVFNGIDTSQVKQNHPEYSGFPTDCDGCEIKQYCDNSCACRKMASTGTLKAVSDAFCLEQQILTLVAIEKIEEYAHKNEQHS
jgi:radical SAM protein with 4Fe4S-binding SPASM domain